MERKAAREGMEVDVRPAGVGRTLIRRRATIVSLPDPILPRRSVAIIEYADTGEQARVRLGRLRKRP